MNDIGVGRFRSASVGLAIAALAACTNDYDVFNYNGGSGGISAGGNPSTGGTPNNGGGGSTTTNQGGSPSDGGGVTTPTTGGGGVGGSGTGGSPVGVEVPCGGGNDCDIDGGDSCCIGQSGATSGTCKGNCNGSEASLDCNEPGDCPGEKCCLDTSGSNYDGSHCAASCSDIELCAVGDGDQIPDLPPGFFSGC